MTGINNLLGRKYMATIIAVCCAAFLWTVPFSIIPGLVDSGPSWLGLDCSFLLMMNYALHQKLEWGTQLMATYGPLAFLANRVMWGIPKEAVLLFDLFVLFNFACIFRSFITGNHKLFAVLFILLTLLLLNIHMGSTIAFLVFFFALFWMYDYSRSLHLSALVMSSICICLCFYTKLNIAFFGIILFAVNLLQLRMLRRITQKQLLFIVLLSGFLLWIPASLLHVNLVAYISSGIHTMSGYNGVMQLHESHPELEIWIRLTFVILVCYYLFQIFLLCRAKRFPEIFYSLLALLYIFLAWKQSILRNDEQHLSEFFASTVMVFYLGNVNAGLEQKRYNYIPVALAVLLLLTGKLQQRSLTQLLTARLTTPVAYFRDYRYAQWNNYLAAADKRKIPEVVLRRIGRSTIDIFPWDVQYLLQNKLNYLPRPDFQSYMVYNSFLQNANYEAYIHHPPQFIIYDYDAIDERYPFNDEGITNCFIAANYTLADTFTSNERLRLLLKRVDRAAPVFSVQKRRFTFHLNEEVDVSQFDYIKISLSNSLAGKLTALLYKPSDLSINYILDNGEWKSYRTSPGLLAAFVYTAHFIGDTHDFIHLVNRENNLRGVSKIKLEDASAAFSSQGVITGYRFQ